MVSNALLTSINQEWETPPEFFDNINNRFNFTLDAAASEANRKLKHFYSAENDGLSKSWAYERVFLNPPYGTKKPGQLEFVRKAYTEVYNGKCFLAACLLPARPDTFIFHEYVMKSAAVYFIRGRLKFVGAKASAVFPSMLVLFDKDKSNPLIQTMTRTGRIINEG